MKTFQTAVAQGATVESEPQRMERWPVSIAFVRDPDGYLVEFVTRHPWPDGVPANGPWLGQYCINVTDIEASIEFFELMGLDCTSRTEIEHAHEAILENPEKGSKLQLAQQLDQDGPIRMGSMWKLYVNTDDCKGLHDAAVAFRLRLGHGADAPGALAGHHGVCLGSRRISGRIGRSATHSTSNARKGALS